MTDIALLDGGVGQEIQKRSMTKAHPLWSVNVMFNQPDIVTKVHRDFIMSGARVISLNTYAASKSRMTLHGFGDKLELTHKTAINLARQSLKESSIKDGSVQVAGSNCLKRGKKFFTRKGNCNRTQGVLQSSRNETIDYFVHIQFS